MNRDDLKELAHQRLEDARVLLEKDHYAAAYYLSGYAVECGLKACIAKHARQFDFPPKPSVVRDIYDHDLAKLLKKAGLDHTLDDDLKADKELQAN
jgi:HEPN domain-containing protein